MFAFSISPRGTVLLIISVAVLLFFSACDRKTTPSTTVKGQIKSQPPHYSSPEDLPRRRTRLLCHRASSVTLEISMTLDKPIVDVSKASGLIGVWLHGVHRLKES